jgi:predicted extracellular nuclease
MKRLALAPVMLALLVGTAVLLSAGSALASSSGVVISEFRFRGPAGGNDEFVELLNSSSSPVDVSGWRLEGCAGASGAATVRTTIPAGTTLAAGQHYLFVNAAGTVAGDATYATGIADDGGARISTAAAAVVDGVGSSDGAVDACREGAGLAIPTANADNSFERRGAGTQDTDDNAVDFEGPKAGNPQGSGSGPGAVVATIGQIQGASHISPLNGRSVIAEGVVTARRIAGGRGFWMQDPAGDGNAATSDGVFVFLNQTPAAQIGDRVRAAGTVSEFRGGCADPCTPAAGSGFNNLTITQINSTNSAVQVLSSGNVLPAAKVLGTGGLLPPTETIDDDAATTRDVEVTNDYEPAEDAIDFYESLEGMIVRLDSGAAVVGPTKSFGEITLLPNGGSWATGLRTPRGGILLGGYLDGNPERITVDDEILRDLITPRPAKAMPDMDVGAVVTSPVVGPLDYTFANYKIQATTTPTFLASPIVREEATSPRDQELLVATFNVENLTAIDPQSKFDELAEMIVHNLKAPDLIGIEEVQDDNGAPPPASRDDGTVVAVQTWSRLIAAIQAAGGPLYEHRQIDPVNNADGGAPGGNIRVGFLFRTDRGLSFTDRPGGDATTPVAVVDHPSGPRLTLSPGRIDPANPAFVDTRKSLVGEFRFRGKQLFVVVNHFSSKGDDQPLFGRFQPPTRFSEIARHGQAQAVNDFVDDILVADPNAHVIVLGDINDFEFSETVDILEGGVLTSLVNTLAPAERYSYVFEGNSQVLDQILLSDPVLDRLVEYDVVHVNAEFAVQASDHEPSVARIEMTGRP